MKAELLISSDEMQSTFQAILLHHEFERIKAGKLAAIFTSNSVDGILSHGVNRFPVFIEYIKSGLVNKDAEPKIAFAFNAIEQWNGNNGPGPLNALAATDRVMQLAKIHGIGCVAMAATNHWMRGGYYGWYAAKKNCILIAWTNTIANMPAWGATDQRLGNNPLVIAIPNKQDEAVVLDMAMSQYSFGAMEQAKLKGEKLEVYAGYNQDGEITTDPDAIINSSRPLPIGYWKGAGLALLLDILSAMLSGGLATYQVSQLEKETGLSQVFISIDLTRFSTTSLISETIENILADFKNSKTENGIVRYPGEGVIQRRKQNLENGIPVIASVWKQVLALKE